MRAVKEWNSDSRWWHYSYWGEWVGSVAATAVFWLSTEGLRPYCRPFDPLDPSINHPYAHSNTVPSWSLPLVGWVLPVVWCALMLLGMRVLLRRSSWDKRPAPALSHELHSLALSAAQAVLLAICLTNPIKVYAARLRPDYVSRLKEVMHFDPLNYTQSDLDTICASTNHAIIDGRRSMPSGHSSIAWAGWTVVALIVYTKLFAGGAQLRRVSFFSGLIVCLQCAVPTWVAVSRTRDYRHDYSDIVAGSAIGVFCGVLCFTMHYSISSDRPFNRKTEATVIYEAVDAGADEETPLQMNVADAI